MKYIVTIMRIICVYFLWRWLTKLKFWIISLLMC
uniref:Uncharacterized protein n=1 Tax=Rhizophora mucronata TaxID=61149 RepID=A0A2P2PN93_RHIMU